MAEKEPNVYPTLAHAREGLADYVKAARGMRYGIVTQRGENDFVLHERTNQPCYGEMRPYGNAEPDLLPEHQRKVFKPGDLHSPFPSADFGPPVLVAVSRYTAPSVAQESYFCASTITKDGSGPFLGLLEHLFSSASPWYHVTKDAEILFNGGEFAGMLFNNTHVDPTTLINFWMTVRNIQGQTLWMYEYALKHGGPNMNRSLALLLAFSVIPMRTDKGVTFRLSQHGSDYFLNSSLDPVRFIKGDPIMDGPTLYERGAYNRPKLADVFSSGCETSIRNLLHQELANVLGRTPSYSDAFAEDMFNKVLGSESLAAAA
jgi:hypothetical protein